MGTMGKKKTKKQSAKATLAEVIKEMAKPRVASSARLDQLYLHSKKTEPCSLADEATLGFAISLMTSASVALADCFFAFLLPISDRKSVV